MIWLKSNPYIAWLCLAGVALFVVCVLTAHIRGYHQGYSDAEQAMHQAARELEITAYADNQNGVDLSEQVTAHNLTFERVCNENH